MMPPRRLHAGRLQDAVSFEAPVAIEDGYGGARDGWEAKVSCRALIRYRTSGEVEQSARMEGRQQVDVFVRRFTATEAIGSGWRLRDTATGTVYAVTGVPVPTQDRRYLMIPAQSGLAS